MDINSLLSPQDAPARAPAPLPIPTSHPAPKKRGRPAGSKRTSSALSHEILVSPDPPDPPRSTPFLGHEAVAQAQQQAFRSALTPGSGGLSEIRTPLANYGTPTAEVRSPFGTPQHNRSAILANFRPSPTPQIEITAEQASLQQNQAPNPTLTSLQNFDATTAQRSPSMANARIMAPPINRTHSAMSSSDLAMAEAPAQTPPPRVFASTNLSELDLKSITELVNHLQEHSYDYNSHTQLINLLHQGFRSHAQNLSNEPNAAPSSVDFSLLSDLRQAREAMDSRFCVGEDIWADWISDESLLAKSSEERNNVVELCMKAVQEEPTSVILWQLYGEWVWSTYAIANGFLKDETGPWTEEDQIICQEVFTRELVLSVWEQAITATKWRIDQSHVVWNRYVELIMQDFPEQPSPKTIEEVQTLYMMRLGVPHTTWEETSQAFWPFVSKFNSRGWEEVMSATNDNAAPGKHAYGLREVHELAVKRAADAGDQTALYEAFVAYLAWECKPRRKSAPFEAQLRSALYERALLKFPSIIDWWLDYVDFLVETDPSGSGALSLLERASRHCPWSGEIWSRRLLRAELENKTYDEVESVKHKATNSGLLETGGMEEMMKVYSSWCCYLRRRAFLSNGSDDDIDMAEVGILGVLEDVHVAGKKTYGDEFKADPSWRIEKAYLKFLTQAGRLDETRGFWRKLVPNHSSSYDFWYRYYTHELFVWGLDRMIKNQRNDAPNRRPVVPTEVLREALRQNNLDWPEKLLETYEHHFEMHEMPEQLQMAQGELRSARKRLQRRREAEAAAAATASTENAAQTYHQMPESTVEDSVAAGKRKRDEDALQNGDIAAKRNKVEEASIVQTSPMEPSSSASAQAKRDREHNTVTVKDLPADVTEKRLRQFFADCGDILSVNMLVEEDALTATATLEFEGKEDVLSAKTRDGKVIDGNPIRIQSGTDSTLYVTNFPPEYDEIKIRQLFDGFGTVVNVRFPSLKFDKRRRFCYVQFLTGTEARAATALDKKAIDGQHTLLAKISDPTAKKAREGATADGREVHVANLDFTTTEQEIKEHFQQSGKVESLRMLKNTTGRFIGTAFVVYSTADEANSAASLNNKPLKSRILRVNVATAKGSRDANGQKASATTVVGRLHSGSPGPTSTAGTTPANGATNGRRESAVSTGSAEHSANEDTARTKRERTVAIFNLPDTVNDARIRAVLEPHGPLRKILVRRDKNGALVEFVNLEDAGRVGMGIDCSSLGRDCRIGEADELMARKPKAKPTEAGTAKSGVSLSMRPTQAGVSRPSQRGGRRGGLGFKRGRLGSSGGGRKEGADTEMGEGNNGSATTEGGVKSNADFRDMYTKSAEGTATGEGSGGKVE